MRVFAYCTWSARHMVQAAIGVQPFTSPPTLAAEFNPKWLEGRDLIYFRLHGAAGFEAWFNDNGEVALNIEAVKAANLGGATVIVANCFGADDPMTAQLYASGASAVIAGDGPNWAASNVVIGTDLLAQWIRRGLCAGLPAWAALAIAKARLAFTSWRHADRDARAFRILGGKYGQTG